MVCLSRPYPFKFFEGCLPQILLGSVLNILSHVKSLRAKAPTCEFCRKISIYLLPSDLEFLLKDPK